MRSFSRRMQVTSCRDAYATGVDEDYKVAECRQGGRESREKRAEVGKRFSGSFTPPLW